MIESVPLGHMRLYSHMRPGMLAGTYRVDLDQDFGSSQRPVETVTKHIEVTAPRFGLPATEVHSVFPPHNAVGPFNNNLPHIALKRRTLPWERTVDADADAADAGQPWLALVILTDGEANFVRNMAVADVLPAEFHTDVADDAVCDAIEVTDDTVEKVFPARHEFDHLLHVRQVNVNDTENAGNDEDGFMAVVMANRLPQEGQTYGAYLISVEHLYAELPADIGDPVDEIGGVSVHGLSRDELVAFSYSGGARTERMDLIATAQPQRKHTPGVSGTRAPTSAQVSDATATRSSGWHAAPAAAAREATASGFAAAAQAAGQSTTASAREGGVAGFAAHSSMRVLNDMDLLAFHEDARLVRFPVLAHWQFTCTEGGDFQQLMRNLDVAMVGSQPAAGATAPPQVTETGHIEIAHVTRAGERVTAWYRGPLTPRQVRRRLDDVPFHSADQARTLGGDLVENLAEAAAFEIGRMLALADTAFVQELLRWRRDGFRRLKTASLVDRSGLGDLLVEGAIGRVLTRDLYVGLAADVTTGLGPRVDPTAGLDLRDDDDVVIARGLATAVDRVRSAFGVGDRLTVPGTAVGAAPAPPRTDFDELIQTADTEFAHLRAELDHRVDGIVADARPRDARRGDG